MSQRETQVRQDTVRYSVEDFGPSHRWTVFVCASDGHPMKVGYTDDEYAETPCAVCGAHLVPVSVAPVSTDV